MEITEHGSDEGLDRKRVTSHMGPRICHTYRQTEGKITRETHNKCRKIETVSSGKATRHVNMHLMLICTYSRLCAEIQLMTAAEKTTNQWKQQLQKPTHTIATQAIIHLSGHLKLDRPLVAKVVAKIINHITTPTSQNMNKLNSPSHVAPASERSSQCISDPPA